MWLACQHRLWTSDRRARHGLQDAPSPCYTCLQDEDNTDHILMQCVYAREVWHTCFSSWRFTIHTPDANATSLQWWLQQRSRFRGKAKRSVDSVVILIAWALWKQRNARVFNNRSRQRSPLQLTDDIQQEIEDWKKAGLGGAGALDAFTRE